MDNDRIVNIILSILTDKATPADREWLTRWAEESAGRKELVAELLNHDTLRDYRNIRSRISPEKALGEMQLRLGLDTKRERRRPWLRRALQISAGAAAVAAIYLGITFMTDRHPAAEPVATALVSMDQLHPGGAKAVLTLADGSKMEFDEEDPLPVMATETTSTSAGGKELSLEVPRGGEFMVVLEDSTKVWLNSSSKLTYPEHFAEGRRHVSIEGEAYFEVAHDSARPFYVEIPGAQYIKVYGTEFNVRSYPEDPDVRTTLAEGKISLSKTDGNGGELFLSPGHQAVFDKTTGVAHMRSADAERVSGWRNGRFVFEEQTLYQIMQDLSRWYDFRFEFADNELRETIFMGSIPRYSNFTTAIAILEKSGGLKFDIADNKVIISKKN